MSDEPPRPFPNYISMWVKGISLLVEKIMPIRSDKWLNIVKSFNVVYLVAQVFIYSIGMTEFWAAKTVQYMWRINPFGVFSTSVPYSCGLDEICNIYGDLDMGDVHRFGFHPAFFLFLIGGFVTVRILVVCFDRLEWALGVDFLSRTIEKFLPGPKPPEPPANV